MKEVKRYAESCGEGGGVFESQTGEFVEFFDYESLQQRLNEADRRIDDVQSIAIRSAAISADNLNKALDRADTAELLLHEATRLLREIEICGQGSLGSMKLQAAHFLSQLTKDSPEAGS